jgi:transcription elongation GreA/GreB family factor
MSKAFTKEDSDAGFTLEAARPHGRVSAGLVTPLGSRLARERLASISARLVDPSHVAERAALELERDRLAPIATAKVAPLPTHPLVVAFGASVRVRDSTGKERVVFVASAGEMGLVPHAASATSPIARALIGARTGDAVEVDGPRGTDELTVLEVRFPS